MRCLRYQLSCHLVLFACLCAVNVRATCLLERALIHRFGISPAGFAVTLPRVAQPAGADLKDHSLSFIALHRTPAVADGFEHVAMIDRTDRVVLIHRTGGFTDVNEWYGPIPYSDTMDIDAALAGCTEASSLARILNLPK